MSDIRPVEVVLQLPVDMAHTVEEVGRDDPEFLSRVVQYGLVRRAVYKELERSLDAFPVPL